MPQPAAAIELEIKLETPTPPQSSATEATKPCVPEVRKGARTPLLILAAIGLLAGIAAGAFLLMGQGSDKASMPAGSDPRAATNQSVEILHPGPKNASGIAVPLATSASAVDSVALPESAAASAAGDQLAPARPTRTYSNAEIRRVLGEMKKQGPQPLDCADAATILRDYYGATAAQAPVMARRGYPDLCSAKKTAPPAASPDTPRHTTIPAAPSGRYRSIDEAYSNRAAGECERGLAGVLCRERLKHVLCNGHWSANPPAGQSTCLFIENSSN